MNGRRLIALFLAWHLFAIAVAALPSPDRRSHFPTRDPADALNPAVYRITLALDAVARATEFVESGIWWATSPIHPAIRFYLGLTGLGQSWAMFSNPPTYAQYMRMRYYIEPPEGRPWVATELILPTNREDRVRLVRSFRDSYRDKAMAIAMARFYQHRKPDRVAPDTRPEQLPDDLAPIARYFSREFARKYLANGEGAIVRAEVWIGTAPIPRLGLAPDPQSRLDRALVLQAYYDGPVEQRLNIPPIPPYHGGEEEADINWILEYYEER